MTRNRKDAELFYSLWFPMLDFVNRKYRVVPKIKHIPEDIPLNLGEVKKVADYVWEHIDVIDEFLAENELPDEYRRIVSGWKRCITGRFMLERHLKKGSVFISIDTEEVYMVSGIISSWAEILEDRPLPILLRATLIPFKDTIITDGLVTPFDVCFGRNYSTAFKEIYRNAKQNKTIHFSL